MPTLTAPRTAQPVTVTRTILPMTDAALHAVLVALGDTPEQVHQTLMTGGYRGRRGCASRCPVAVYLLDLFPDVVDVDVDQEEAVLYVDGDGGHTAVAMADMPPAVTGFIHRFDNGVEYTDLNKEIPLGEVPA